MKKVGMGSAGKEISLLVGGCSAPIPRGLLPPFILRVV
jgi:hypothetical protein